ncbi:hypothetical protein OAT84_02870 [Gammaproteobacteria bacterium]|nr:hypothetical protein [Gammaproteobacteria bacterium]
MLHFLVSLLLAGCTFCHADEIALVVNNHVITQAEVSDNLASFIKFANIPEESQQDPMLLQSVSEMMIRNVLIEEFANRNQLQLTAEESESSINNYLQSVGATLECDEYIASLGVSPKWGRSFILSQALMGKVGSLVVGRNVVISDEAVSELKQTLFDENCEYLLRSWMVSHDDSDVSIDSVKQIKQQWAQTAQDPAVGEVLDLGWKKKNELPELFITALEGIDAGNVVGPLVSENGYHLIWFEKVKSPALPEEAELRNVLFQRQFQTVFSQWLMKLEENNVVIRK